MEGPQGGRAHCVSDIQPALRRWVSHARSYSESMYETPRMAKSTEAACPPGSCAHGDPSIGGKRQITHVNHLEQK